MRPNEKVYDHVTIYRFYSSDFFCVVSDCSVGLSRVFVTCNDDEGLMNEKIDAIKIEVEK